jgi:8-oxo-dGTP pyrophosphatase MutT (NUDIX family)
MDREPPATREALNDGPPTTPREAAAVILLREVAIGFEVLLVRRNPAQRFMGGYWVFPGGAVDTGETRRAAALRELHEEAAVAGIATDDLECYSRWITPELLRIRFDTRFFLAVVPDGTVARADGRECVAERWGTPRELLAAHDGGDVELAFPTMRQLEQIAQFPTASALLAHAHAHEVRPVLPRIVRSGEVARLALPGDRGYDTA